MVVRKRRATYNDRDIARKKRTSSPLSRPIQHIVKRLDRPKDDYVLKEVRKYFINFRKYSKIFENIQKFSKIFKNFRKYSKIFEN